jgi:ATP-binding cassette subfamily B protein
MAIDDQADARESLKLLLELEGTLVLPFGSGLAALDWLEQADASDWPQVLVCDIALGDEDGHQVMRRVRQLEARRGVPLPQRLPAVALTGFAQAGDRVRSLMAGFQVHLAKPVEPRELVTTLYMLSGRAGPGPEPAPDPSHPPTGSAT